MSYTPEERSKDARGRSENGENCSGREPTATTLNKFKVVAEVRRFTAFCKGHRRDAVETQ
ncbi:hypothetical protein DPMN_033686 [Dreissena polymorpha]|uniref:Uncharacterized protein n=1 Tax=Dreissena polymorpha TaxID=45954 RepID=A0A9D4M694_DREPO|nr:hypothetical protein DPMN_033686 [Dreissena polymorpha]